MSNFSWRAIRKVFSDLLIGSEGEFFHVSLNNFILQRVHKNICLLEDDLYRKNRVSSIFFIPIIVLKMIDRTINIQSMIPISQKYNSFDMSKDFFQRNVDLMNELRSEQFKVKEYMQRGRYRMKQKLFNKGKKHYDFDLNSQQYFHEQLNDISFQSSQIQEQFNNYMMKLLQQPCEFKNHSRYEVEGIANKINQSEARHLLSRFFSNRVHDLKYEKYLIMERLHNINAQEQITFVKSRITLIDKEIQMALSRADRLGSEDYFQQTYTMGGKPIPINENGQSIYKYLDEEQCWYSNIQRDDILIYTRNKLFRRDILNKHFYPTFYEQKYLVQTHGLDFLLEAEEEIAKNKQRVREEALRQSKNLIALFQEELEMISPGNLVEKENINSFIYYNFGAEQGMLPLNLPLYPALQSQLIQNYNIVLPYFFKSLEIHHHKELIALLPKLNNFCAIVFKYQNKEVLEGKQEIKLGLEDDIDIKKELFTMLEEIWTNKYVKIDYARYDIRYRLQVTDWPLDTISEEHQRHLNHHVHSSMKMPADTEIRALLNIIKSTNYSSFRKHLKKHSQSITNRLKDKFLHMQRINKYNVLNNQEHTLQQLGQFFRIKFNEKQTHTASMLKENATLFFNNILKKYLVNNPVEIQIEEIMRLLKIRDDRVKLMGMLNGMRCYHRNLAFDLRVISDMEFEFHLDDQTLINANKQVLESFEKAVKDTQTYFSKESNQHIPIKMSEQQFVQHNVYERSKLYKKDRVKYYSYGEQIPYVLVNKGHRVKSKILYQIVNKDIEQIEERMVTTCTNFVNRYERFIKVKSLDEIVDRVELLLKIYQLELQFQFEKLKLIEAYYYIYENTKEPLEAYKISKIIVNLIYKQPSIDLEETSFEHAYHLNIEALKSENLIVTHLTTLLQKVQHQKCKTFHDKFARNLNIPLTLQAYLYGDLEKKINKGSKLQRLNSFSSKLSKQTHKEEKNIRVSEIRQQVIELEEDEDEENFDLEKYDQYLLRKNMDAIFEDMMGDQNGPKQVVPVNTVAIENLVVNPRFEGGPHIKVQIFPKVYVSSSKDQSLVNFTQTAAIIGNIRYLIDQLRQQFQNQFGYVSSLYQLAIVKMITNKMYKCCLEPEPLPPKWLAFETDDPYLETVTKCMKYYEEIMTPCLQPPSNVQLAIQSTYDRHHEKIPVYGALQYFDYNSINSLIMLKKPVNAFRYKEHNLGIGFMELIQLQESAWKMQLQRRGLSRAYHNLGKHCELILQRSVSQYTNTGQSQVFLATQENKFYNSDILKYPIYPDMIEEIRQYFNCEWADIEVFRKHLLISKKQLMDLLIMKFEIDKNFEIKRIDKSRLLAPHDPKDLKKIKNRIAGMISIRSSDVLKSLTFLKYKSKLKSSVETKMKEISQRDYDHIIEHKEKMTPFCRHILTSKYRRYMQMKLLRSYSQDLLLTAGKLNVCSQTLKFISKLKNYATSVPFLASIFTVPTQDKMIDSKILYDQAKSKNIVQLQYNSVGEGEVRNTYYLYTEEQFLYQWFKDNNTTITSNLDLFDTSMKIENIIAPDSKDAVFKWAFKIPQMHVDINQRDAVNHVLKVAHPFTGRLTHFAYKQTKQLVAQPPRNKYYNLMQYYKSLVQYIQANMMIISLQVQDDILYSLESIIKKKINFQERYFMTDQNSIRQTINTLENQDLSVFFNFFIDFEKMNKQVAQKMQNRHYIDKKQHWEVHDEITDFLMSKIQGYGVIRQSYLPLCDDLKTLKDIKGSPTDYLATKTNNIYKLLYLSSYETYLNEINEQNSDFYAYQPQVNSWLCHCQNLQNYNCCQEKNSRINISCCSSQDENERQRFNSQIYVKKSNMLTDRMKYVLPAVAQDVDRFVKKIIFKQDYVNQSCSYQHNFNFMTEATELFKTMGERNRFKLFARIRYHYDLTDSFIETRPANLPLPQKEVSKAAFLDLLIGKKAFILATICFTDKVILPVNAKKFKETYMELKEINQIQTHSLYQNLDRYREENKIQFSKGELSLIGKNQGNSNEQHNNIINEVLSYKLLKQEFRYRVLYQSIRLLKAQRLPKTEPKRIVNASLIPRVHLISSYSSPLMLDRKSYISQQYKLSFLQAFINRFRNKVSRVDLLSSGYGFVITVPDLQDCVNYMNKLLFTFTEKQFKYRIETFSQYAEILMEAVNDKNKVINEQSALIKYLQTKNNNLLQAEYLSKVTKLLHEKTLIEDQLLLVQNNVNGLEDRVRKTVQIQYDKKIAKLQKENQELREIFSKVKHLHMVNTRQAAKNDYLDIVNFYRNRISEVLSKKVDFTISFEEENTSKKKIKVGEEDNSSKYRSREENKEREDEQSAKYVTEDLNRCKLGEDILFDPYYTTKLINKMRLFNLFRLGSKRLKFEAEQFKKDEKIGELNKIQDIVVVQSQREILIRNELSRVQQELSKKNVELERIKTGFDFVENQKTKLKILMQAKEKKIEQKDREIDEMKAKLQERDKAISILNSQEKEKPTEKPQEMPKLSLLRKQKKYKKAEKPAFLTNIQHQSYQNTISLFDKFQLSSKDGTWRQKCQQLYIQNKKLQAEIQKCQASISSSIPSTPKRQGYSLNMRAKRESFSEAVPKVDNRFPNISFKYSFMKQ